MMIFNLKEKCCDSKNNEFYYGAKIDKRIKDVYLGTCILAPYETDRKIGPGRGHEEILYVIKGRVKVKFKDSEYVLNEGELIFIQENKVLLSNLTDSKVEFVIAGGHTKPHKH